MRSLQIHPDRPEKEIQTLFKVSAEMKTKLQFDPTDTEMLRRALNTMCKPARRHKCQTCFTVFECQFCSIGEDSHIHTTHPFLCEECIHVLGIKTVFVALSPGEYHLQEIDYVTGERLGRYRLDSIVTASRPGPK